MSSTLRAYLRLRTPLSTRSVPRRFASSSSSSPNPSLERAQKTAQKAYDAASKHAGNAFVKLRTSLGPIGDSLFGVINAYRAPVTYNLAVAKELLKQVYVAERLQPPLEPQVWIETYTTLLQRVRNPSYWREIAKNGQWKQVGLYGIEAYTIFKIGEIIGRRSLVGYNLE